MSRTVKAAAASSQYLILIFISGVTCRAAVGSDDCRAVAQPPPLRKVVWLMHIAAFLGPLTTF